MTALLSTRGEDNIDHDDGASQLWTYCYRRQYHSVSNPDGIIALAEAENRVMRHENTEDINTNVKIDDWHLTYGDGWSGSLALTSKLATYLTESLSPRHPIIDAHICLSSGGGTVISNFAFCVGEPGDGILVARPVYPGFITDISAHAKLKPICVSMDGTDPLSLAAVDRFEEALGQNQRAGQKIVALLLSNQHNPLGQPYSKATLVRYLELCGKYGLHLLSDEVFTQTWFSSRDFLHPLPMTSVLSLDLHQYLDPALVHVCYSISKDFGFSGARIGCFISPFNPRMLAAYTAVNGFTRPSSLSNEAWTTLLTDRPFLNWYFPEMRRRLSVSYNYATSRLSAAGVTYSRACCTVFVWMDLSNWLTDNSAKAELELGWRLVKAGVWIALGTTFKSEMHGNYRMNFATPIDELKLGLDRLLGVLTATNKAPEITQQC